MRILLLNSEFPPIGGGAANATRELLREFRKQKDVNIDLVTSGLGGEARVEQFSTNVRIFFEPIGQTAKTLHTQSAVHLLRYALAARRRIHTLLRGTTYDLCHAFFTVPAGAVAYQHRKTFPYLISLRGADVPGFTAKYRLLYPFLKPLIKKIWNGASAVVANSEGLRTLALRTSSDQDLSIIPNGVDTELFSPAKKPSSEKQLRILTVARLTQRKRIDRVISALVDHPHWQYTIVGSGEERGSLERLAKRLGVMPQVTFRGNLPHEQLPDVYRAHDLFVLPSENEGMSNTLLEAMACGLPAVVTDTGGTSELMKNRSGTVIPRDGQHALECAIQKYENVQKRKVAGDAARDYVENYSWVSVADAYYEQYLQHTKT